MKLVIYLSQMAPKRSRLCPIAMLILLWAGCAAPEQRAAPEAHRTAPAPAVSSSMPQTNKPAGAAFPETGEWINLFDGKTLKGWAITDFAGHGEVQATNGTLVLGNGVMTGVTWTNDIPRMNFEVELEA